MTWDLWVSGDQKKEEMAEKCRKTLQEVNEWQNKLEVATKFCDSFQANPVLYKNDLLQFDEILNISGVQDDDDKYISTDFLEAVRAKAFEEEAFESAGKIRGRSLLKLVFFQLKDLEDSKQNAQKRHTRAKNQLASHKTLAESRQSMKRKNAETECDKVMLPDDMAKDRKLARRNQINRKRKGIEKVKKKRSEENLPEACTFFSQTSFASSPMSPSGLVLTHLI